MTLDPRRLLVLRAVHRHGGVHAAATHLGLTPSAVSQHLARLEAETGLALLDRSRLGGGRSLLLTAVGRAVSEHADDLASALAAAEQTVSALRGAAAGPVVVGAFPTAVRRLVAPAVAELQVSHPAVTPRVVEASDPAATYDLAAGRLDLAVLERDGDGDAASEDDDRLLTRHDDERGPSRHDDGRGPSRHDDGRGPSRRHDGRGDGGRTPGVVVRPLLRDPYRVVVPASWGTRTTEDVMTGPWVGGPPGSTARAVLDRLARSSGRAMDVAHACLEFPAVLALVGAGLGAALVPDLALDQLSHPDVRTHDDAHLDAGARVLTVAHRAGRHEPSAAAEVVLAALRRQAARPDRASRDATAPGGTAPQTAAPDGVAPDGVAPHAPRPGGAAPDRA